jgi:hypothetical protein
MHLSSKFPLELRLKIWQCAMPPPRIVHVNRPPSKKRSGMKDNPALLFVNKESQKEVLQRYQKFSGNDDIYVDFSQEAIFIDTSFLENEVEYPVLYIKDPRIQILAVDYKI